MIRSRTNNPGDTIGRRVAILLALLVLAAAAALLSLRRERSRKSLEREEDWTPSAESGAAAPGVEASVALVPDDRAPSSDREFAIRIIDACTGGPVSGARLTVRGDPRVVSGGWTELVETSPGEFAIERGVLGQDELPLTAAARGYQRLRSSIALESLSAESVALVKMVPVFSLGVVVLDAVDGRTIGGVPVELRVPGFALLRETFPRDADGPGRLDRTMQGVTDRQGRIVFDGLPPGSGYKIAIVGDDLWQRSDEVPVEIRCEDARAELRAERGSRIIGQVLDCEGVAGAGFEIICKKLRTRGGGSEILGEADVRSGPDGRFELVGLRPGKKLVRIQRKTGGRVEVAAFTAELSPGMTYDCGQVGPVPVAAGGVLLRGTVVDDTGAPVPRAQVDVSGDAPHKLDAPITLFESDEHGAFEVCGLPAEKLYLEASARFENESEWRFARASLEPRPGEVANVLLELRVPERKLKPGGTLRVDVRLPSGEPADLIAMRPRASVIWEDGTAFTAVTSIGLPGEEGVPSVIEFKRPPPGEYGVLITGGGFIARLDGCRVGLDETTTYTAVLRPARAVSGRVLGKDSGETLKAVIARRLVERSVDSMEKMPEYVERVRAGDDGRFSAPLFDFGEAGFLVIRAEGYKQRIVPVKEDDLDLGDIYLIPDRAYGRR